LKLVSELYDHENGWFNICSEEEIRFYFSYAENRRSLEIAAGTGRIALPLLQSGCDLYGIDGSWNMLKVLHSKLDMTDRNRFILWDARQPPYPAEDHSFEFVFVAFSTFSLLHNQVEDAGDNRILHEISRLLKPGGHLVINDWRTTPFDHDEFEYHDNRSGFDEFKHDEFEYHDNRSGFDEFKHDEFSHHEHSSGQRGLHRHHPQRHSHHR